MVESRLALGFRHINTAAMYDNEAAVAAALAASGINHADLFVTKVWHDKLCNLESAAATVAIGAQPSSTRILRRFIF